MKQPLLAIKRIIKWTSVVLVGIVLLVAGCWTLLPDEVLDPKAKRLLEATSVKPKDQNAYYALLGLKADPALDPYKVGQEIVASYAAKASASIVLKETDLDKFYGANPFKPKNDLKEIYEKSGLDLLKGFDANRSEIESAYKGYNVYVERYQSLRAYPFYEEVMPKRLDAPWLTLAEATYLSSLINGKVALDMEQPRKRAEALNELARDMAFWKKIGSECDSLLTKVVSVITIHHKYQLISALLTRYPEMASTHDAIVAEITAPMTDRDRSMRRVMAGEFLNTASMLFDIKDKMNASSNEASDLSGWLKNLIFRGAFRPNATVNLAFDDFKRLGDFLSLPAKSFLEKDKAFMEQISDLNIYLPSTVFYNPIGKVLVKIGMPVWDIYGYRLNDLSGYTRLVDLQRRIAKDHVDRDGISTYVKGVGSELFDPYSEMPMHWNGADGTLSFKGYDQKTSNGTAYSVVLGFGE